MTSNADPWRTLGLNPGASLEDVRRAYRRLAKANHPDAAGETALPRFLAIQAAYEQILGPMARRRPGTRPGPRAAAPREPWEADPERARASGRADGRRPGARPAGQRNPGAGATGSAGATGDRASTGETAAGGSTRQRRSSSRRRAPNRRTPYSTSYDPVDEEPFEPGWTGATWYGASSGTYWTINPKEWADPRKHGPEYQRRARRGAGGWILDDEPGAANDEREPDADEGTAEPRASAGARPAETSWTDARAWSTGASTPPGAASAGPAAPEAASAGSPDAVGAGPPPRSRRRDWLDEPPPERRFRGPVLRQPGTPAGRLAMALLGWPPLALAVSVGIGEETGCGRFAASCSELSSPGTLIVMAALLVLLLALPRLAVWAAHGTIATLLVGIPGAIVLSAGGGARQHETSAAVLMSAIVVSWLLGVLYAIVVPRLRGTAAAYHGPDEPPQRRP